VGDDRIKIIQSYRAGARTVKQRQRDLIAHEYGISP
jgi:hypothetical protein